MASTYSAHHGPIQKASQGPQESLEECAPRRRSVRASVGGKKCGAVVVRAPALFPEVEQSRAISSLVMLMLS